MQAKMEYKNKYFSILGDSVSTFEGVSTPKYAAYYNTEKKIASDVLRYTDTWWGQVIEVLGGRLLVNNSWSGSTVCFRSEYQVQSYACSDERTSSLGQDGIDPDVIIVFMGTNDFGMGLPIVDNTRADNTSLKFFFNAYNAMIEKLKKNYPNAEIWCLTLPISFLTSRYCGGRDIFDYCNAIQKSGEQHHCRVIDLRDCGESYATMDGFHPNAKGMKTIAHAVITALK